MSSIYKDPSIGNLINIVIVKLVIINNELVRPLQSPYFQTFSKYVVYILINEMIPLVISQFSGWSSHFI